MTPQQPTHEPSLASKRFADARARAALKGAELVRSDASDGPVRVFVVHQGSARELRTLDELESVLT